MSKFLDYTGLQYFYDKLKSFFAKQTDLDTTNTNITSIQTKLDTIEEGATKITVDEELSDTSTNPVQNKVIYTKLGAKIDSSIIGVGGGVASLDESGLVPSTQLPSYVDDVIEGYFNEDKFYEDSEYTTEITSETGKIYVDLLTNYSYRYSGSTFILITSTDMIAITNDEIDEICT